MWTLVQVLKKEFLGNETSCVNKTTTKMFQKSSCLKVYEQDYP